MHSRTLRRARVLGALLFLTCAAAAAQRAPVTGTVLRSDGSPWEGAVVRLHSLSWTTPPSTEFQDHLQVVADPEGRFRAEVLGGRAYTVWSTSPVVDGAYTTTETVRAVASCAPVELREGTRRHRAVELSIVGGEEWADVGPLSVDAFCMLENRYDADCERVAEDRFRIPALPASGPLVRVRDRFGRVLASGRVVLREDRRQAMLDGDGPDVNPDNLSRQRARFVVDGLARESVHLPDPIPLEVLVRHGGDPVPGAELLWADRTDRRPFARTGPDGIARLMLPADPNPDLPDVWRYVSFWVRGEGVATVHAYRWDVPTETSSGETSRWVLDLPAGHVLRGRLWWRAGVPAGDVPLQLHTPVPGGTRFPPRSGSMGGSPLCYRTDPDGSFEIPGRVGDLSFQLTATLSEADQEHLADATTHPYAPVLVIASGNDPGPRDLDLGHLVLSEFGLVDVTVLAGEDRPACGAPVYFRERFDGAIQEKRVGSARVDGRGQIRLVGRPGATLVVTPIHPDDAASAAAERDIEIAESPEAPQVLEIELD